MDKHFYNEASAARLGWEPDWFGALEHDETLLKNIKEFQKQHGLSADGLCGPTTYRRIWTQRESEMEHLVPDLPSSKESFIIYNNNYFDIEWPKVVLPFVRGGLKHSSGFTKKIHLRKPKMFICHWDVCLNSSSCFKVLQKRGLSIHFTIDNDGTIRQHLDMNHVAYHAGSRKWNEASIGVELSNAYYPKYNNWYKRHGFGERPLVEGAKVHGKTLDPFLDFYPVQIEALKALIKAVHKATGIKLAAPTTTTTSRPAVLAKFDGVINHYHLTKNKIDCANIDLPKLIKGIM